LVTFVTPEYLESRMNGTVGSTGEPGQVWTETPEGPRWVTPAEAAPTDNMFTDFLLDSGYTYQGTLEVPISDESANVEIRLGFVRVLQSADY